MRTSPFTFKTLCWFHHGLILIYHIAYSSVCYEECLQCESASKVFQLGGLICDCKSSISTKVCFQLYCQRVLHLSEDRLGIRLRWWYHNFLLCLEIICNNTMSHPPHSTLYILHWMLYQLLSICPTTPHLSQFFVLFLQCTITMHLLYSFVCLFQARIP